MFIKKLNRVFNIDSPWVAWFFWFALFILGSAISSTLLSSFYPLSFVKDAYVNAKTYGQNWNYILQIVMDSTVIIGFLILSFYKRQKSYFFIWKNCFFNNILGWGIILFYSMISIDEILKNGFSFLAMVTALVIAIAEEMAYRGQILIQSIRWTKSKNPYLFGLLLSSFLFAVSHLVNLSSQPIKATLIQVITTFSVGLILGVIYLTSGNFFFPVMIHFLIDFSALTQNNSMNSTNNSFLPCIVMLAIAVVILSIQNYNNRLRFLDL